MTQEVAEIVAAIEGHHAAMVQELAARAAVVVGVGVDGGRAAFDQHVHALACA
jgi:hypothetical protein